MTGNPQRGAGDSRRADAVGALHQAGHHDTTDATRWASRSIDRPFTILRLTS